MVRDGGGVPSVSVRLLNHKKKMSFISGSLDQNPHISDAAVQMSSCEARKGNVLTCDPHVIAMKKERKRKKII